MNTTKVIYDKLFTKDKVELESHRIELGVADDISKNTNDSNLVAKELADSTNKALEVKKELVRLQIEVKKIFGKTEKTEAQGEKIYTNAKKIADSLGVSVSEIKGYKDWISSSDAISKAQNAASEIIKNF